MSGCAHGGAFFEAVGDEFDRLERGRAVINADVLDAWFPPAPGVMRALGEHLEWLLRISPPPHAEGLTRVLARARGVGPENVLCGAGSSALIFLALRHWLRPSSRVLLLDPTYGEYAHVLDKLIGCRVERLPLSRADGYVLCPDRLRAALGAGYDWVILVNPNSPTGRHVPRDALAEALRAAPAGTRIWVDETYVEYAGPGQSLEGVAARGRNVVVCKSMSKVYALSGARVGYLCGPAEWLEELRPLTPPYAVSLPAQVAAVAALGEADYYAGRWAETDALREALAEGLRATGRVEVVAGRGQLPPPPPGGGRPRRGHGAGALPRPRPVPAQRRRHGAAARQPRRARRGQGRRHEPQGVGDLEKRFRLRGRGRGPPRRATPRKRSAPAHGRVSRGCDPDQSSRACSTSGL